MRASRKRWLLVGLVALAAVVLVVAVRMRRGSAGEVERLWSASDLPGRPEPATNGWAVVQDARTQLPIDFPTEHLGEIPVLFTEPETETVWRTLDAQQGTLSPIIAAFERSAYRDVWHRARALPRFVDACPDDLAHDCPELLVVQLHRIAVLDFMLDAREGHWDEALRGMRGLLQIELDYQASARDVLAQISSADMLADGMTASLALVQRATSEGVEQTLREQLANAAIEAEFEPHLDRVVVLQYLRVMQGLDDIAAAGQASAIPNRVGAWLFSPRDTGAELNRYFRTQMTVAEADQGTPAPAPAQQCPLRLDPAGCELLQITATAELLPRHRDDVLAALRRAAAAQAQLRE